MTFAPMLADKVKDRGGIDEILTGDHWVLERKIDGHRLAVHHRPGRRDVGYKRNGALTNVAKGITEMLAPYDTEIILDGEWVGNRTLWVFDMPVGFGCETCTLERRRDKLEVLFDQGSELLGWDRSSPMRLLDQIGGDERPDFVEALRGRGAEGVIAKQIGSMYRPGKRHTSWRKLKFTHDVDCFVTRLRIGGKDNFGLGMIGRDGDVVEVAECTRGAGDGGRVKIGDVVTVKCLYSTPEDKLYQPTYPKLRDDKAPTECTIDQLDDIRPDRDYEPLHLTTEGTS